MKVLILFIICLIVFSSGCFVSHQKIEETKTLKESIEVNGIKLVIESEDSLAFKSEVKVIGGKMVINIEGKEYE